MKTRNGIIFGLIVGIILAVLLFNRGCGDGDYEADTTYIYIHKIDTVWRTITITEEVPIEIPIYISYPVPANVDTAEILKDYFACRYYEQILFDIDTLGFMQVRDSVCQNRITWRDYTYENRSPIITETITEIKTITRYIEPPDNIIAVGLISGGDSQRFSLTPILTYKRKNIAYIGGYDVLNEEVKIGVKIDIKKW